MSKTIKIIIGIVIIAVLFGFFTYQKSKNSVRVETGKEIKIGALYALTGPAAKFGEVSMQGARDAVEYYKQKNKDVNIRLIEGDSQGDPKQAVSAAMKMFNIDGVKFSVVGLSGVSASIASVADQNKSLVISDAALFGLTKNHPYMFQNFMPSLNDISKQINKNSEWNKVAIVYINDEFGNNWAGIMESQIVGGKTVKKYSFEKTATDYKTEALKVRQFNPDVSIVLGYGPALNQVLSDLSLQKVSSNFITYLSCTLPGVLDDKRFSLENQYSYEYPAIVNNNVKQWMKGKNREEQTFYTIAFENTLIAIEVAIKSDYSIEKATSILKQETFNGLYGGVKFNNDRVVDRDLFLTKITDGKCEVVR